MMHKTRREQAFIALTAVVFLLPVRAWAQQDLNMMMTSAATESLDLTDILSTLSYVMGAIAAFLAMLKFKAAADGQAPVSDGIWRLVGAAALVAAPWTINTVLNTIYPGGTPDDCSAGGANSFGCRDHAPTAPGGAATTLDQIIVIFVANVYKPAKFLIQALCFVLGIACCINGIKRLAESGQGASGRAPKVSGTVGYLLGGALLISLGNVMDVITTTLFVDGADHQYKGLAYIPPGVSSAQIDPVFQGLFAFVEILGWIGFARGVYLLIKLAQGDNGRTHVHAFTHIIAGAMAVNMAQMITLIQNSLGLPNYFITTT